MISGSVGSEEEKLGYIPEDMAMIDVVTLKNVFDDDSRAASGVGRSFRTDLLYNAVSSEGYTVLGFKTNAIVNSDSYNDGIIDTQQISSGLGGSLPSVDSNKLLLEHGLKYAGDPELGSSTIVVRVVIGSNFTFNTIEVLINVRCLIGDYNSDVKGSDLPEGKNYNTRYDIQNISEDEYVKRIKEDIKEL